MALSTLDSRSNGSGFTKKLIVCGVELAFTRWVKIASMTAVMAAKFATLMKLPKNKLFNSIHEDGINVGYKVSRVWEVNGFMVCVVFM